MYWPITGSACLFRWDFAFYSSFFSNYVDVPITRTCMENIHKNKHGSIGCIYLATIINIHIYNIHYIYVCIYTYVYIDIYVFAYKHNLLTKVFLPFEQLKDSVQMHVKISWWEKLQSCMTAQHCFQEYYTTSMKAWNTLLRKTCCIIFRQRYNQKPFVQTLQIRESAYNS